jgi:hypothetical protein
MGMFDFLSLMDNVRQKGNTNVLGDFGKFFGGDGIGKGIEDWTNPVTQLSDRNPILSMIKGEGNLFGSYKPQGGIEETINRVNTLAGLIYGGYMGAAAMGAGEGAAGSGGAAAGGEAAGGGGGAAASEAGAEAAASESGTAAGSAGSSSLFSLSNVKRALSIINNANKLYNLSKGSTMTRSRIRVGTNQQEA